MEVAPSGKRNGGNIIIPLVKLKRMLINGVKLTRTRMSILVMLISGMKGIKNFQMLEMLITCCSCCPLDLSFAMHSQSSEFLFRDFVRLIW